MPLRSDGAERNRNWAWLKARYQRLFPEWEIVERDCDTTAWVKGRAVNTAVAASSGEVLVIADADVMVAPQALAAAVMVLPQSPWVVPHEQVWRMNEETTKALLAGQFGDEPQPLGSGEIAAFPRLATEGGGISVMWRKDFIPMDERFVEWGGEDISAGRAWDTLIGKHRSLPNPLWHLWHEPMPMREGRRALRQESEDLANRYYAATTSKETMRELIEEANAGVPA